MNPLNISQHRASESHFIWPKILLNALNYKLQQRQPWLSYQDAQSNTSIWCILYRLPSNAAARGVCIRPLCLHVPLPGLVHTEKIYVQQPLIEKSATQCRLRRSVGASSASAAREAAAAGAKERSSRRNGDIYSGQLEELARVKVPLSSLPMGLSLHIGNVKIIAYLLTRWLSTAGNISKANSFLGGFQALVCSFWGNKSNVFHLHL